MSPELPGGGTGARLTPMGRLKRPIASGVTVLAGSTSGGEVGRLLNPIVSAASVAALRVDSSDRCLVLVAAGVMSEVVESLGARAALVEAVHPVLEVAQSARARQANRVNVAFYSGVLADVPARGAYDLIVADETLVGAEELDALVARIRPGGTVVLGLNNPLAVSALTATALDAPELATSSTRPALERAVAEAGLASRMLSVFPSMAGTVIIDDAGVRDVGRTDLLAELVDLTPAVVPLWQSLIDAGSSANFSDAFLAIVAGASPALDVWPRDLVALDSEGARWVVDDGDVVRHQAVTAVTGPGPHSFIRVYRAASAKRRADLLHRWVLLVEAEADASGASLQLLPDRLAFDHDSFVAQALGPVSAFHSADFVVRFGLLVLARAVQDDPARLQREATRLGRAAGVVDEGWIAATIAAVPAPVPPWATAVAQQSVASADPDAVEGDSSSPETQLIGTVSLLAEELQSVRSHRDREVQRVERLSGLLEDARAEASRLSGAFEASQRANHENHLQLVALSSSRGFRALERGRSFVNRVAPWGTHRRGLVERALSLGSHASRQGRRSAAVPLNISAVPTSETPLVSIVIPIHGKWDFTARCLASVAREHGGEDIEVIVVDDASPDGSRERLAGIAGVRVIPLDQNVGFTKAANAGISAARGPYVVMLNNDAEVTPGWLTALLEAAAPGVGIVGAKLVYPDGRLQEAGGIIFSDGTGWNYGKFDDADSPEYNFRRRVDYCSGAAILLTPELLDLHPGFDERYAPAYYEDTDLAFAARAAGLEVVYEPRSVVIHHEGISNGTDLMSGTKRYQEINRAKFAEKWVAELAEQFEASADNVPLASQRRSERGTVVVIDHMVPTWNEDSGSLRMKGILTGLIALGYDVLFVPDNKFPIQPYTAELQRLGVQVWTGWRDIWAQLRSISPEITTVILSRASVAAFFIRNVREVLPQVPILFDTVDLHFLREQRRSERDGGNRDRGVVATRELELAIIRSSEVTAVVSEVERDLLAGIVPESPVVLLPNVHEAAVEPLAGAVAPAQRSEITFVGSFAHDPNIDAVDWLVREIFPLVRAELPDIRLVVVGKNPPPELVEAAPEGVDFLGWVEDLDPVHARSLVNVAPLRYGAGVKGKVGDAWVHGVPTVMTALAAEGMSVEDGVTGLIADDAAGFASAIVRLVRDESLWSAMSAAARTHVDELFGVARSRELLEQALALTRQVGRS